MAKVKIQGHASGTGILTVTAPNTSTDRTITLPDSTGTLLDENSSVPAANLTGTIADARFPATLPAASATNLTAIPAANITGTLPAIDGSNLTGISSAAGTSHFHAIFTSSQWNTYTNQSIIGFNNTFRNVGNDFSTSNNRYVAPATGVYYFYYMIYTALSDSTNGFTFRKNGATTDLVDRNQDITTYNEQGTGDHVQTGVVVVNLSANDYMEVYSTTTSDLYTGHSSFGGFRIS
jgi:hypothetical protein